MINKRFKWLKSSAFVGLFLFALGTLALGTIPAFTETLQPSRTQNPELHNQLKQFRSQAFELRREASVLQSFTPGQLSWQTHTYRLDAIRDHVNDLGKQLAALEVVQANGTEAHQMAIDNVRPHLIATAQEVREAFALVNENRGNVKMQPFTQTVNDLYEHAASLYETVDTILDYENARVRLQELELPSSEQGS